MNNFQPHIYFFKTASELPDNLPQYYLSVVFKLPADLGYELHQVLPQASGNILNIKYTVRPHTTRKIITNSRYVSKPTASQIFHQIIPINPIVERFPGNRFHTIRVSLQDDIDPGIFGYKIDVPFPNELPGMQGDDSGEVFADIFDAQSFQNYNEITTPHIYFERTGADKIHFSCLLKNFDPEHHFDIEVQNQEIGTGILGNFFQQWRNVQIENYTHFSWELNAAVNGAFSASFEIYNNIISPSGDVVHLKEKRKKSKAKQPDSNEAPQPSPVIHSVLSS